MSKTTKVHRETATWLFEQPIEIRVQLIQNHLELCRIMTNQLFEDIVSQMTGPRYEHDPEGKSYYRHGYNPGSIKLNDQKLPVQIPRIREASTGKCVSVPEFSKLKKIEEPSDEILNRILHGISTRDYKRVTAHLTESLGLSSSQISREFIDQSELAVKEFCERTFEDHTFSALMIDGKSLASEQMVIALGVTDKGYKIPLGFIQTASENSRAISQLLRDLIKRKFKFDGGILVIIDGSTGIKKAVVDVFGRKAIIQRCQWHKRENVLGHLNDKNRDVFKTKIQNAYREPDYKKAKAALVAIQAELKTINQSAANSLTEGLEETLALHKLNLARHLCRSLGTTNCIESLNSQLGKYTRNVKRWTNSNQRHRWVAAALLQIESRMKKIHNFKSLKKLNEEIKKYLKLNH
jgi:transposase-like protein